MPSRLRKALGLNAGGKSIWDEPTIPGDIRPGKPPAREVTEIKQAPLASRAGEVAGRLFGGPARGATNAAQEALRRKNNLERDMIEGADNAMKRLLGKKRPTGTF